MLSMEIGPDSSAYCTTAMEPKVACNQIWGFLFPRLVEEGGTSGHEMRVTARLRVWGTLPPRPPTHITAGDVSVCLCVCVCVCVCVGLCVCLCWQASWGVLFLTFPADLSLPRSLPPSLSIWTVSRSSTVVLYCLCWRWRWWCKGICGVTLAESFHHALFMQ